MLTERMAHPHMVRRGKTVGGRRVTKAREVWVICFNDDAAFVVHEDDLDGGPLIDHLVPNIYRGQGCIRYEQSVEPEVIAAFRLAGCPPWRGGDA